MEPQPLPPPDRSPLYLARSTDDLSDALAAFCSARGLEHDTHESIPMDGLTYPERLWVAAFALRHAVIQREEDFRSACRARGER